MRQIMLAIDITLFLHNLRIVMQRQQPVFIVVYETVLMTYKLMKPDRGLVVVAKVPEGVHGHTGRPWHWPHTTLLTQASHNAAERCAIENAPKGFFRRRRVLTKHTVALLASFLRVPVFLRRRQIEGVIALQLTEILLVIGFELHIVVQLIFRRLPPRVEEKLVVHGSQPIAAFGGLPCRYRHIVKMPVRALASALDEHHIARPNGVERTRHDLVCLIRELRTHL